MGGVTVGGRGVDRRRTVTSTGQYRGAGEPTAGVPARGTAMPAGPGPATVTVPGAVTARLTSSQARRRACKCET